MYRKTAIVMTLNNKLRGASSYSEAFSIVKKIIDDSEQFPRGCEIHLLLQDLFRVFIWVPCFSELEKILLLIKKYWLHTTCQTLDVLEVWQNWDLLAKFACVKWLSPYARHTLPMMIRRARLICMEDSTREWLLRMGLALNLVPDDNKDGCFNSQPSFE